MPVHAARMVCRLAAKEPAEPIAAVLRPCEERALTELVKAKQASLERVVTVVIDCPGAAERAEVARLRAGPDGLEGAAQALFDAAYEPTAPGPSLRAACAICDRFVPGDLADIQVELLGHEGAVGVRLSSRIEGRGVAERLGLAAAAREPAARQEVIGNLVRLRRRNLERELGAMARLDGGVGALLEELAACIRCGACRQACPQCFCRRCTFETPTHEHEPDEYLRWTRRRGATRLPEDVLLYHLTRLTHVALSCVSCGACESVCPQGIKLTRLFAHVGPRARRPFDYVPGRSVDDPLPLSVFEREELEPR
jgi:formate dehydrogenase subunit beta